MECGNCGATLREGARFCNKCGASQSDEAAGSQQNPPAVTLDGTSPASGDAGSSGRARRPPRVPRAADGSASSPPTPSSASRSRTAPVATDLLEEPASALPTEPPGQAGAPVPLDSTMETAELAEPELAERDAPDTEADEATETDAPNMQSTVEAQPAAGSSASDVEAASPSIANAAPESEAPPEPAGSGSAAGQEPPAAAELAVTDGATDGAAAWEDADTVEYSVVLQRGQSLDAIPVAPQPTEMPALNELARAQSAQSAQSDVLPWPLPQSIIIGGRYRVEDTLATAPDAPGAENVYRVRDLQGYERCWSCGAEHGEAGAPDRFCQKCGADMLSHDYLLRERRQEADGAGAAVSGDGAVDEQDEQSVSSFTQGGRFYHVLPRIEEPPLFPRGVRVVAAMATDTGASRTGEENEDSAGILTLSVASDSRIEPLTLGVVADGLGGHASGQEASRLAVRVLSEHILRTVALPYVSAATAAATGDGVDNAEGGLIASLKEGIEAANKALCARNRAIGADMGSTCVAVLLHRATAYFANAGDSRGYVLEDDGLRRITTDHSLVEQLIAGGLIPPEERYTHPQRNQIFRSLGDEPNVALDTFTQKLRPGMRLLLCSDGLWEMVRDDEMARILRETASPQQACDVLVAAANDHGGEDNISAVVVDVYA